MMEGNLTTDNNPFSSGSMIRDPQRFFGRREELELIITRLNGTQHEGSSVVGERRIGKSSLLHYLYQPRATESLRPQAGLIVVYLDAADGGCETPDRFRATLLAKLINEAALNRRTNDGRWLLDLRQTLPNANAFSWMEARQAFDKLPGHPVVCLDEIESLFTDEFDNRFFDALRSWQNEGVVTWITASKEPLQNVGALHGKSSPFFNLLATVKLGDLAEVAVASLLDTVAQTLHPFTEQEKRQIRQLAGSHPYHLQIVAEQAWRTKQAGQPIDWQKIREYLCAQSASPAHCRSWRHKISQTQIAWILVIILLILLLLLVPAIRKVGGQIGGWFGDAWKMLGSFGDGVGGLIIFILLIIVVGGGVWKHESMGTILRNLWSKLS